MMKQSSISIQNTGYFSNFFTDYISQNSKVTAFYNIFPTKENLGEFASKRQYNDSQREILVNVLTNQYADIENAEFVLSNIQSLLNTSTYTITTGHQLNLATGPMYVILKLITTIKAAKELSQKNPSINVVPIYWMATEDHDFEEINHFNLFGKKHTWQTEQKGAVGRFEVEAMASMFPELTDVPNLIEQCYVEGISLVQATRKFVHALFGKYGLVCLEADDKALKTLFIPIVKDELLHSNAEKLVLETNQKLKSNDYKVQVNPRNINLFYLDGFVRERIEKQGNSYVVLNTDLKFSEAEILQLLESSPEKFSPNVILRPLYQSLILPDLATVGGPSEVVYWMQLKSVFDFYKISFPALMPRNFALIANVNQEARLQKLSLQLEDLFQNPITLKQTILEKLETFNVNFSSEYNNLNLLHSGLLEKVKQIDTSLVGTVGAEINKVSKIIEDLEKKILKTLEKKNETSIGQILNIRAKLFPNDGLQERSENFLNFYINNQNFVDELLNILAPFEFKFNIITI